MVLVGKVKPDSSDRANTDRKGNASDPEINQVNEPEMLGKYEVAVV